MSTQDSGLEDGTAQQRPGEQSDSEGLCASSPTSWLCFILYWLLVILLTIVIVIGDVILQLTKYVIKALIKLAIKKKSFLLLCVMAIILDPLFFYVPLINDENKCIEFDKNLRITSTVLRSAFDVLKLIHILCVLLIKFRERRWKHLGMSCIDILAILPIPQVLVNFQKITGSKYLFTMSVFFLLQYLLRVIRVYFLFKHATGVTGILAEATWAIFAFNLLLYMHGGHVFGALWYFYAVGKQVGCWEKACTNQNGCSHRYFRCDDNIGDYTFLNDFCTIKTGNTTNYDFGLYTDAVESGLVEMTDFPKKLLHCLQWGLQSLGAFGQNLQPSMDIWENIFAICMTTFGVVLFVFLIGRMQSDAARSQQVRQKWREIKQWPNFEKIPSDIQGQLRKYKRKKWQETKRVDVYDLLNDLPEDLGRQIRRKLCLELLKKVNQFKDMRERTLGELCDCLKPAFFMERTRIIREGDPIDEMLFVLKGKLWTSTSASASASASASSSRNVPTASFLNDRRSRENYLEDGDFCGQELIAWALNEHSSNLPTSTRTIQALTNVDAFILMADDLKHVLLSIRRYDRIACFLQSLWRSRRARRNGPGTSGLISQIKKHLGRILSRSTRQARAALE